MLDDAALHLSAVLSTCTSRASSFLRKPRTGTSRDERAAAWMEMTGRMADVLDTLLNSPVYGEASRTATRAPKSDGICPRAASGRGSRATRPRGHSQQRVVRAPARDGGGRERGTGSTGQTERAPRQQAVRWAFHRGGGANHRDGVPRGRDRGRPRGPVLEVDAAFVLATPYNSFATS